MEKAELIQVLLITLCLLLVIHGFRRYNDYPYSPWERWWPWYWNGGGAYIGGPVHVFRNGRGGFHHNGRHNGRRHH